MSQYFFRELNLLNARNRYKDRLRKMDSLIFPERNQSFMNDSLSSDDAEQAIIDFLEQRMKKGSVTQNLIAFAQENSGGEVIPDECMVIRDIIFLIDKNREFIRSYIARRTDGDTVCMGCAVLTMLAVLATAGITNDISKSWPWRATLGVAGISFVFVAAIPLLRNTLRRQISENNHGTRDWHSMKSCSKREAMEILELVEALADIYRDER